MLVYQRVYGFFCGFTKQNVDVFHKLYGFRVKMN